MLKQVFFTWIHLHEEMPARAVLKPRTATGKMGGCYVNEQAEFSFVLITYSPFSIK